MDEHVQSVLLQVKGKKKDMLLTERESPYLESAKRRSVELHSLLPKVAPVEGKTPIVIQVPKLATVGMKAPIIKTEQKQETRQRGFSNELIAKNIQAGEVSLSTEWLQKKDRNNLKFKTTRSSFDIELSSMTARV